MITIKDHVAALHRISTASEELILKPVACVVKCFRQSRHAFCPKINPRYRTQICFIPPAVMAGLRKIVGVQRFGKSEFPVYFTTFIPATASLCTLNTLGDNECLCVKKGTNCNWSKVLYCTTSRRNECCSRRWEWIRQI